MRLLTYKNINFFQSDLLIENNFIHAFFTKKSKKVKKVENVAYYKIPVDFEITGNFLGYIKFKRQLSLSKKMLNFDKEIIKVVKGDTTGTIKVTGTLTIVGLADEFF